MPWNLSLSVWKTSRKYAMVLIKSPHITVFLITESILLSQLVFSFACQPRLSCPKCFQILKKKIFNSRVSVINVTWLWFKNPFLFSTENYAPDYQRKSVFLLLCDIFLIFWSFKRIILFLIKQDRFLLCFLNKYSLFKTHLCVELLKSKKFESGLNILLNKILLRIKYS